MNPPLQGMRVIELAHVMSGPICGMMLADMGADVVKVEKGPDGDEARQFAPFFACGESASFLIVNRNKRGMAINLKVPRGREVLLRLIANADVVTENFRKGTLEKFGLGYETLREVNPGLIYCAISGYGRDGPLAAKGGFDLIAQGMCGLMSLTGEEGHPPVRAGSPIADINAGILAALGICAAYVNKLKTGRGQMVDTSLFEAGLHQMFWPLASYFAEGKLPPRLGSANATSAPYQAFRSKDGWINVGAANQANYERLLEVLDAPEIASDPRFRTNADRIRHRTELVPLLTAHFMRRTTEEWLAAFDAVGLPAGPVLNIAEAASHPQTAARGMIPETDHPVAGRVKGVGLPIHFSESPPSAGRPAPLLGQHTRDILLETGYSEGEIRDLAQSGAILIAPSTRP